MKSHVSHVRALALGVAVMGGGLPVFADQNCQFVVPAPPPESKRSADARSSCVIRSPRASAAATHER
jgi:hypothetical protein